MRAQLNFDGELRAIGDVLRDQLSYMKRSGFNSFDMRSDQPLDQAINYLDDFSEPYQAAIDRAEPLFLKR